MAGSATDPDLDLEFPPRPEYVRMARHAVGALARRKGLPGQTTMDLELAASEACNLAIGASSDGVENPIRLVMSIAPSSIEMEVRLASSDAGDDLNPDDTPFERSLSLAVIRALVDEISARPWDDGKGISYRIVVQLGESRPL